MARDLHTAKIDGLLLPIAIDLSLLSVEVWYVDVDGPGVVVWYIACSGLKCGNFGGTSFASLGE